MSNENETAINWWNGLSHQERFDFVFETWNSEGKPEPKGKKKREKRKPKLDLREVEELAYRSKRGVTSGNDVKKIIDNFANFGDMPEFKAAVMRGQARAISELPLQGTVDEVMERLQNHA